MRIAEQRKLELNAGFHMFSLTICEKWTVFTQHNIVKTGSANHRASLGFDTVDGRNPAPVEVGSLPHYLQGFSTIPGGFSLRISGCHQQYALHLQAETLALLHFEQKEVNEAKREKVQQVSWIKGGFLRGGTLGAPIESYNGPISLRFKGNEINTRKTHLFSTI